MRESSLPSETSFANISILHPVRIKYPPYQDSGHCQDEKEDIYLEGSYYECLVHIRNDRYNSAVMSAEGPVYIKVNICSGGYSKKHENTQEEYEKTPWMSFVYQGSGFQDIHLY